MVINGHCLSFIVIVLFILVFLVVVISLSQTNRYVIESNPLIMIIVKLFLAICDHTRANTSKKSYTICVVFFCLLSSPCFWFTTSSNFFSSHLSIVSLACSSLISSYMERFSALRSLLKSWENLHLSPF